MALPIVEHYNELKNEAVSLFTNHRTLILVSAVIMLSLIAFGTWAMNVRSALLAKINSAGKDSASEASTASPDTTASSFVHLPYSDASVAGMFVEDTSPSVSYDYTYPTPTPYPLVTIAPYPTVATVIPVVAASTSSCASAPTVENSQVYVSPSTVQVGNAATISVELMGCNNTASPVSDSLKIELVSGDSGTKINGASLPVTIETKNGKVSFSVTSSVATTATFLITDTARSFPVTMPGYHNPSVTFTSGSSGSSGNPNCTTSAGAPNAWYSDVYPNPPITTNTGSVGLQVVIRDCFKNTATVDDALSISLSSGDSGTKVNGNSLPYTLSAQNGVANFTVSSQVNGTVTLVVTDTAGGFTITDPNNHNPSITFSSATTSSTPTPTPTPSPTDTPTPTPQSTPTTVTTPTPTTPIPSPT